MDEDERKTRLTKIRNVIHGIVNRPTKRKFKQEHHPDLLLKALANLETKNLKDGGNNKDD